MYLRRFALLRFLRILREIYYFLSVSKNCSTAANDTVLSLK